MVTLICLPGDEHRSEGGTRTQHRPNQQQQLKRHSPALPEVQHIISYRLSAGPTCETLTLLLQVRQEKKSSELEAESEYALEGASVTRQPLDLITHRLPSFWLCTCVYMCVRACVRMLTHVHTDIHTDTETDTHTCE